MGQGYQTFTEDYNGYDFRIPPAVGWDVAVGDNAAITGVDGDVPDGSLFTYLAKDANGLSLSRQYYAVCRSSGVEDLQPNPGTHGFAINWWMSLAGTPDSNPMTGFPAYQFMSMGENNDPSTDYAWRIVPGGSATSISFQVQNGAGTPRSIGLTLASGWNMYTVACDCVTGGAPLRSYVNGVLDSTGADDVDNVTSTSSWAVPALHIGSHLQLSATATPGYTSMILNAENAIAHISIFKKNLTTAEILNLYTTMTT